MVHCRGISCKFYQQTNYVRFSDRNRQPDDPETEELIPDGASREGIKRSRVVCDYALERYPEIAATAKIASITKSDHVNVDYDTVAYKWCYKMFADLELYVDFCNDRQQTYEGGEAFERKQEEMRNNRR